MNIRELLNEHDVDLTKMGEFATLVGLFKVVVTLIARLERESESATGQVKEVREAWADDEGSKTRVDELIRNLREDCAELVDNHPEDSAYLYEALDSFKSDIRLERDVLITLHLRSQNVEEEDDTPQEWNELRETADKLRDSLSTIFLSQRNNAAVFGEDAEFEKACKSAGIPVKRSKQGNELILDKMSDLRLPADKDGSPRGLGAAYSKLRFRWNGETLPAGITPPEVYYRFVSDRKAGLVYYKSDIQALVEEAGFTYSKGGWTIELPTGKLEAFVE